MSADDNLERKKADRVILVNDHENIHRGSPCGPEYQCADEIVKEILGEDGPASKLREAQQRSSTGDREKARNDRPTRNGTRSNSYTVKRPKPPLSFFIRPLA